MIEYDIYIDTCIYFVNITVKKGKKEYAAIDTARQQAFIRKDGKLVHEDCLPIYDFCMQLLQPILGWMPLLDRDNIHIGALQTSMANFGQVDHFDWERFKLPPMKKDGQSWEIDASLSIIIQLRG